VSPAAPPAACVEQGDPVSLGSGGGLRSRCASWRSPHSTRAPTALQKLFELTWVTPSRLDTRARGPIIGKTTRRHNQGGRDNERGRETEVASSDDEALWEGVRSTAGGKLMLQGGSWVQASRAAPIVMPDPTIPR
jgi:hypothetical protein